MASAAQLALPAQILEKRLATTLALANPPSTALPDLAKEPLTGAELVPAALQAQLL